MLCLEEMGEVQAPSTSMNASSLPLSMCVLRNIFSRIVFSWWGPLKMISTITWWWGNDETVSQGRSGQYIDQLQFLATDGSSYGPYGDLSSHCLLIYILLCREQCSLWASFPFCGRSHFLFAGGGGGSAFSSQVLLGPRSSKGKTDPRVELISQVHSSQILIKLQF